MRFRQLFCRIAHLVRHPRFAPCCFTIVVLGLICGLLFTGLRKGGAFDPEDFNDFKAYHSAAEAALRGDLQAAYDTDTPKPYQYPPTLASLILPLGLVSYRVGLCIWIAVSLAILLWSFRVLDRVLCPPVKGIDKFFGLLLAFRAIESDFANSNANVMVFGLVLFGFALERRAWSFRAGLAIALATCIKVSPVLLVPWMLYRRRWRLAGGFAVGLVLWGALVPGTILGPTPLAESWRTWYQGLLAPLDVTAEEYTLEAPGGYLPGQSVKALVHRLGRPIDATAHDRTADGSPKMVTINAFDVSKTTADVIYLGLAAAILGGLLFFFWKRGRDVGHQATWGGAEIAVAILLTVLLSPLARKAHFVVLLPAATYGFMLARVSTGWRRRLLSALWIVALALLVLTSREVVGKSLSTILVAYCPFALAAILLAIMPLFTAPAPTFPPPRP